jgi:hypothetical protein
MDFDFAEQLEQPLETLNFSEAVAIAEAALGKIPETAFHAVVGQSLTAQAGKLCDWIEAFYQSVSARGTVAALYFEMNEFDVNTDEWRIDGFAYARDGGLDRDDMEWLCDSFADTDEAFVIGGYERLQAAFAQIDEQKEGGEWMGGQQDARDWCEQIVLARFMELTRAAHAEAARRGLAWARLPLYFTEHSYDFVVKSSAVTEQFFGENLRG